MSRDNPKSHEYFRWFSLSVSHVRRLNFHVSFSSTKTSYCNMETIQAPLAQLVPMGTSLKRYAVWGFPLSYNVVSEILYTGKRTGKTSEERPNRRYQPCLELFSDIQDECFLVDQALWPQVLLVSTKEGEKSVLGVVQCTRPDKRRLPSSDKIEEFKSILAKYGFTEEAGWFVKLNM